MMLKNYIKAAWRAIIKNKLFSSINILGLSVGMAACLLILEYVSFNLTYDNFNKNYANLYRLVDDQVQHGKIIQHSPLMYSSVSKFMKSDFPEIANYSRVLEAGGKDGNIIFFNNQKFTGEHALYVENSFLSMFSYPLIYGDQKTALAEPNSIVISSSLGEKLCGSQRLDPSSLIGKVVSLGDSSHIFKITGVCQDAPDNSHLEFDCLASYTSLYQRTGWTEADNGTWYVHFRHYIMLRPEINPKSLETKFAAFSQQHYHNAALTDNFHLQPLSKIHMHSDMEYDIAVRVNYTLILGLLIIAILILMIAWANYISLTTAKSIERAKEVGIRKVAGATRSQLIGQFMAEALIVNFSAILIALILVLSFQRSFNALIDLKLSLTDLFRKSLDGYSFYSIIILFVLSGIFISGFYPAFVLSSFKPIVVLKGKFHNSFKGIALRKALVVGQFTITVVLIISSFVVSKQMRFINNQDLGFKKSEILIVPGPQFGKWDSTFISKQRAFTSELRNLPGVSYVVLSGEVPGNELTNRLDIQRGDKGDGAHYTFAQNTVTPGFFNLYNIKILAGRDFSYSDYQASGIRRNNIILNNASVKVLGFESPESAIGHQIIYSDTKFTIVGVLADFHQQSLHYPIEPTLFMPGASPFTPFSLKISTHNLKATIGSVEQKYVTWFPGNVFQYYFLDEKFDQQYASDVLFGKTFELFSCLAIFIACLGLLGLSFFATLQRSKEVGIRKVLGASAGNIVITLSKDFIRLVIWAIFIASPIAWLIMHEWLQNFAIRDNISWWIFALSGFLAIIIAFLTIGFQSIKAATANPIKSLRSE